MPNEEKLQALYNGVSQDYDIGTFEEFSQKMQQPEKRKAFFEGVGQEYQLGTLDEFENKLGFTEQSISGEGRQGAKGVMSGASGKISAEPTKSGGLGSATKEKPQRVELQSQLPTNLSADQTQQLIESNIQGAELAGLDYESIAQQAAGKSPVQLGFEQLQKIQDPKEKFETARSLYKVAANQVTDDNSVLESELNQFGQGIQQMQSELEAQKQQYDELVASGDSESANILGQQINEQLKVFEQASGQYNQMVGKYNDNAKFLGILNAGRVAAYGEAERAGVVGALKLPMGTAVFSNMIAGTSLPFSPDDVFVASTWNAIAPNIIRTLGAATALTGYFDSPAGLNLSTPSKDAEEALLNIANAIEVDASKYTPKGTEFAITEDVNAYSVAQLLGSLTGSVAGSIGSAGLAGTGKAAMVFNGTQGFGEMYSWGRENGLDSMESTLLATPVALIYGYLGDKGVESLTSIVGRQSFKNIVKEGLKELGEQKTPQALSQLMLRSLKEFGKKTAEGTLKEGLQEGVEFTTEFGTKKLAAETGLVNTNEDLTLQAFQKGLTESMVAGAVGGGLLGGLLGDSPRKTLADVVAKATKDPIAEQEFIDDMNSLLQGTQITREQYDEVMGEFEKAKAVNQTIPNNVTNDAARSEAIDLIQERDELQQQAEVTDPAMVKPLTDRIKSIEQRLQDISEGKLETKPEDIQQQQDGMIEKEQPETPVETIDLTPTIKPQENEVKQEVQAKGQQEVISELPQVEPLKTQENVTTEEGQVQQGNIGEYQGVTGQEQGQQENRQYQEGNVSQAETKTGNINSTTEGRSLEQEQAKDEVISKATGTKVENIKGLKQVLKDVFGLNNMQSDSVAVVMDRMIGAMAVREGVGKDEMYSRVLVANSNEAQQLQDASNIVLQALQDNTVATPVNQLAKAFAPFLTQQETADMLSALGETEVNDAAIDKFAKGFEKYLSEGVAPDKSLEGVFKRFQKWLTDIYNGIKGSEIDLALNDKMREIYSAMLGFEVMNAPTQQAEQPPNVTMSDAFANLTALAEELKSAAEESAKKKLWSDKANKIADSLDNLIDDINNSDVAMVGIPFAKQIVVKALEVFRDAFRAGGLTLDAFQAAYEQMIESLNNDTNYNSLSDSDKEEIQNDISEHLTEKVLNNLISGEERKSRTGQRILEGIKSKSDMSAVRKALDDSYESRSQDELRKAARVLIKVYGIDKAVRLADDRMMAGDLRGAVYSAAYTEATLAFESDPSPENRKRLTELAKKIKAFGIEGGQQQASMNIIYEDNPEFQIDEFKWNRSKDVKSNLGTKGQQKVQEIIDQVPKLKKDLFNALSNVLNGQMDAVELFAKDILADKRIKAGITKLVNLSSKLSNADKTKMSELFAKLRESGKLALEENITEVRQLIIDGLKSINPELQTKLSDSQINDIADEFSKVYSDIANEYLTNQINNAFKDSKKSGQQKKNGQVAKLILQGVLDEFDTMNAFAIKFGIPSLTPQQAQRLKALAQRVNQSTGGQKVAAKNQLNAYLKSLKNQPTTLIGKAYRKLGLIGSDFASYFINNILFGLTAVYALGSNLFRLTTSVMYNAITGETDAIKFAFGNLGSKEILMPDGTTRKVGFSLLKDGFLAAISGIPKLADFMMQGIPLGEMKIRQAKTKAERRARRTFLAASGRLFSSVDAVTVPLYKAMNQYSVLRAFVVQAYRDNDAIPKKGTKEYRQWKLDVDKQVRGLIGLDMTAIDEVAADAMDIVMKGTLVADLIAQGNWNANNPFPTSKDRLRPNSAAGQIYNEFMTTMYEIIEDGKQGRFLELMNSLDSMGNFLFDQAKNEIYMMDLKDIDKLLAKNTNELSYFGRPPGTAGKIYDVLISLNNAAPILKYSGYSPIFIGAVCNAAHYAVKTYPVLNAIQYALYKGSGKRGFMREKQFESESNFALKLDQRDMLASVLATTAATIGVASYLLGLYDSDDEEKKALEENRWTGYVNSLTAAQRSIFRDRYGNPLKEGFYYKDGYPMYAVNRTPLFGIFEAAGFWKNTNLFEQSKKTTDLFVDEQENKSFQETLGAYLLNGVLMSAKTASLADLTRSINSILISEPTELGGSTSEKIEKDVQNRTARFVSNLIPFNSLQKQIMDAVTSASGNYDKKVASNFYEKVGMNTAFAHYIVKSNLTDMFGRPLAESFDARGLLFGFNTFEFDKDGNISTIVDKLYATDKYMATHIKHNYGYNLRHTSRLPITVTTDGSTLKEAQDEVAKLKEQGIEASVPKKEVGTYTTDEVDVIEVIFEIPDESLNLINEQMGKSIKDMFDISGNIEALNNDEITKEGYKRFMDAAYNYARVRATYEMHKEELGDSYKNVVNKALKRVQGNDLVKDGRISLPENWQDFD